jgi:GR25 family glycosyltransferase involved in LPS biosynthesis
MNLSKPLRPALRLLHGLVSKCRFLLPRQRCPKFIDNSDDSNSGVGPIFVINLDRQPGRWADMLRELDRILDVSGKPLSARAIRYSACDARARIPHVLDTGEVDPSYTLGEQLFAEPQPLALPDAFDLGRPIRMTDAEIAVAHSHIGVWREIVRSDASYALVLEDDVWFHRSFGRTLCEAWGELEDADHGSPSFDILYVSYNEVRGGAPKELVARNVFRPERGLWYMSGYVLSRKGAEALLALLPCRGPIDLWINHKFRELNVRALRRSLVNQRQDLHSTNSYSVLPALTRIGILDGGDGALFQRRPVHSPVFAFGPSGSELSSLAMAISMLGYRCCSDLDSLPESEHQSLFARRKDRVFDAYVNIRTLASQARTLADCYPEAKYIVIDNEGGSTARRASAIRQALEGVDVLYLERGQIGMWRSLCEHLKLAPPDALYPSTLDSGLAGKSPLHSSPEVTARAKWLRHDQSPWIAKAGRDWEGLTVTRPEARQILPLPRVCFEDDLAQLNSARWLLRNDTFPGNLGLFRPANVSRLAAGGLSLDVKKEALGVREFSAAAISSRGSFLFGRFEVTLRATNVPGLVTGFFLHRDSPRQEIDIEVLGRKPTSLLVNVFYNPGSEGAKFDYGYRGTPALVELGFDASQGFHQYAVEWDRSEIRWFVDQKLVHRRAIWNPTPIPHLPMTLHVNTWPARSRGLAGRLAVRALPAATVVRRVAVDSCTADALLVRSAASIQERVPFL